MLKTTQTHSRQAKKKLRRFLAIFFGDYNKSSSAEMVSMPMCNSLIVEGYNDLAREKKKAELSSHAKESPLPSNDENIEWSRIEA